MRILGINPNTTEAFNQALAASARQYVLQSSEVDVVSPAEGPRSIEGSYDEALSVLGVLKKFWEVHYRYDGFVVACYSDHLAVEALREITTKPVIGIAEASMRTAAFLGHTFSVVTTNDRWKPILEAAADKYGLADRCVSVRTSGLSPLDLEQVSFEETKEIIERVAREALEHDEAEVICLGCAGMAGFDKQLQHTLGVPVLDGFVCALKLIEFFGQYEIAHSKRKRYEVPGAKGLVGLPEQLSEFYKSE